MRERLHHGNAARHENALARSPLEIVDFLRRTAGDDSRAGPRTPRRTIQGRREHDLRQAVELVRKRLFVTLFHVWPIAAEHVVCDTTQKHRVALVHKRDLLLAETAVALHRRWDERDVVVWSCGETVQADEFLDDKLAMRHQVSDSFEDAL